MRRWLRLILRTESTQTEPERSWYRDSGPTFDRGANVALVVCDPASVDFQPAGHDRTYYNGIVLDPEAIRELKQQPGKSMHVVVGATLVGGLMKRV
jgi:hypothetical protein